MERAKKNVLAYLGLLLNSNGMDITFPTRHCSIAILQGKYNRHIKILVLSHGDSVYVGHKQYMLAFDGEVFL